MHATAVALHHKQSWLDKILGSGQKEVLPDDMVAVAECRLFLTARVVNIE